VISEAYDFDDQREAVRDAEELAEEIELIVLDSATGFYRLERAGGDTEGGESLRKVAKQVTHLLSLARRHDIAVVITNQVFTDPDSDRDRALGGNTLNHWTGAIVRVDRPVPRREPTGDAGEASLEARGRHRHLSDRRRRAG